MGLSTMRSVPGAVASTALYVSAISISLSLSVPERLGYPMGTTLSGTVFWAPVLLEKAHQLSVHLFGVAPAHAMRTAGQLDELDVLEHLRLPPGGRVRRQNAIGIAAQDERRHV